MEDIKIIPTLKQIEQGVATLSKNKWFENYNISDVDKHIEKISNELKELFGIIPNFKSLNRAKDFASKISVFRARKYNTSLNKNFICEHSYPPVNLTKLSRCNFPNHPVMYCSDNPVTALFEVANKDNYNKKYFISKWDIIPRNDEMLVESFLLGKVNNNNHFEFATKQLLEKINESFEDKLNNVQIEGLKLYFNFLQNSFLNDDDYSISTFLTHRSLYAPHSIKTDVLLYPSVQTPKRINFAFHPNFVDTSMSISRVYFVQVKNIDKENNKVDLNFLQFGKLERGHIKWEEVNLNDSNFKKDFEGCWKFKKHT